MTIALALDASLDWDAVVENNRIRTDSGLFTSVAISLFTDAAATAEELEANGFAPDHRNGSWMDAYPGKPGDVFGSKLWLLKRAKVTESNLAKGKQWVEESLAWMTEDRVAKSVDVANFWLKTGHMIFRIVVTKGDDTRWTSVWNAATGEGAEI